MPNTFSVNGLFYASQPRVGAERQPWAGISERLRRSRAGTNDLLDEFLRHQTYQKSFFRKVINLARNRTGLSWEMRCLAILMAEHQLLKLQPDNLEAFDYVFTHLNLSGERGLSAE